MKHVGLFLTMGALALGCGDSDAGGTETDETSSGGETDDPSAPTDPTTPSTTAGTSDPTSDATTMPSTTFATSTTGDDATTSDSESDTGDSGSDSTGRLGTCEGLGNAGLLLHSGLDDAASTMTPIVGNGSGEWSMSPADDFVAALIDGGVNLDAPDEYVRFPQATGDGANIDLSMGTIDFCFRPNYDHLDSQNHAIFGTGDLGSGGGLRIRKAAGDNGNAFQVIAIDTSMNFNEFNGSPNDYAFLPGEWYRVTVSWDFTVGQGEANIRVWIDGQELVDAGGPTGPTTMPTANQAGHIYVGSVDETGWGGDAVFDDFKLYDAALVP